MTEGWCDVENPAVYDFLFSVSSYEDFAVAVGENGTWIYTTDDGETWSTGGGASPWRFRDKEKIKGNAEPKNSVMNKIPSQYALKQNYPNPFNPTTKIEYQLPFDSRVNVEVFSIDGRKVVNLVNEIKNAGYYTLEFDGSNLASGIYLYRIAAEGKNQTFVKTLKMLLIK